MKKKPRKITKRALVIFTSLIVTLVGITTAMFIPKSKKQESNKPKDKEPVTTEEKLDPKSLEDLGEELPFETKEQEDYGNTTGSVNKETVTKGDNGKYYIDEDSKNKADNQGTVTDTKGGTLVVDPNGNVHTKDDGYEIKDSNGNTVSSGVNNSQTTYAPNGTPIPDGYAWDPARGAVVKAEDVGKYVYDENGDLVPVESLGQSGNTNEQPETTQPENNNTEVESIIKGTTNPDGTYTISYTIDGVTQKATYKSEADYQQFLINPSGYGLFNGVIQPIEDIMNKQKTLTR